MNTCYICAGKGTVFNPKTMKDDRACDICDGKGKTDNLLGRELPKWPEMRVSGMPVTFEQAEEIIRRTDLFFHGHTGNAKEYAHRVYRRLRMPLAPWEADARRMGELDRQTDRSEYLKILDKHWKARDQWTKTWGCIQVQYVYNDWITSSFICGGHGWCRPDGLIEYHYNVGKCPKVPELVADWRDMVAVFPFLNIGVTLWSEEWCVNDRPKHPIVSLIVKNGTVTAVDPGKVDVHKDHPPVPRGDDDFSLDRSRDHPHFPPRWFDDWERLAKQLFKEDK